MLRTKRLVAREIANQFVLVQSRRRDLSFTNLERGKDFKRKESHLISAYLAGPEVRVASQVATNRRESTRVEYAYMYRPCQAAVAT